MTYIIRFPIGDWSGDGHSQCDYYEVRSDRPVQSVREAHFKAPNIIGFDIGDMCNDYEDNQLTTEMIDKLNAVDVDPRKFMSNLDMDSDSLIKIWLAVLNYIDPTLQLKIIESKAENINFYGFDDKNRHLETPGYGIFYA